MARIGGVDIPRDKRMVVSLTYIYGIAFPNVNLRIRPARRVQQVFEQSRCLSLAIVLDCIDYIEHLISFFGGVLVCSVVSNVETLWNEGYTHYCLTWKPSERP